MYLFSKLVEVKTNTKIIEIKKVLILIYCL